MTEVPSKLSLFNISFEYDVSWAEARKQPLVDPDLSTAEALL